MKGYLDRRIQRNILSFKNNSQKYPLSVSVWGSISSKGAGKLDTYD